MLGAIYGATQGAGGRMMPGLKQAFPRAISLVEDAARAGERGEQVTTRLGRSSPRSGYIDAVTQESASEARATASDAELAAAERRAGSAARDRGRFTRNFVVQGTAAEWALCWLAELRNRLAELAAGAPQDWAPAQDAHLVLFLHDEVVVHTPAGLAENVCAAVQSSAQAAGRIMFGDFPIDFPLDVAVVDDYGQAQ
jgi:DNA polymerase-1